MEVGAQSDLNYSTLLATLTPSSTPLSTVVCPSLTLLVEDC
jgi:hypothetical protein